MSKKGGNASSPAADAQARIAQQLFTQTDPIRRALIARSSSFLGAPTALGGGGGTKDGMPSGGGGKAGTAMGGVLREIAGRSAGNAGSTQFAGGGPDSFVTGSPTYLAYKDVADRNFSKAKDNAIARLPAGGGLVDSLADLEGSRAADLTQAAGNIYENELARAMSLATGATGQSMSGFGQAGATQAALAQANAQESGDKAGALGTGLGAAVGMAMKAS